MVIQYVDVLEWVSTRSSDAERAASSIDGPTVKLLSRAAHRRSLASRRRSNASSSNRSAPIGKVMISKHVGQLSEGKKRDVLNAEIAGEVVKIKREEVADHVLLGGVARGNNVVAAVL